MVRGVAEFEVRYAETDQMGVVHHANYLVWFELARTRFCAEAGLPYPEIEARGYLMIITRAEQDYRRAARYGDRIRASCRLDWFNRRSLQFSYRIERGDELLTTGITRHIWVRRDSLRPCRLPDELHNRFEAAGA
ncbi:acyl-CoA thioester hydrolase [Geothermobacter ehrlichii]|uniref:Acyl-CoA thioester hydrolase n=1 Tax=Geothermobacter ehrlichii TaxID=213224 RepID=A0A5D3WLU1_9BACT|nr:thioesterase family protein [Geothermobacter ehrlichii]TYO99407.1 acyl-CoA thioester hydrolase [Geothermobacter ehrlichii]